MNWFALVVVMLVLGGVGCLFWKLNAGQDVPVSCIHCGKCVAAGECVYVKERKCGKKGRCQERICSVTQVFCSFDILDLESVLRI